MLVFRPEDPARLERLMQRSRAFDSAAFDPDGRGLPYMPPYSEEAFDLRPDAFGHPRILFTAETLPLINSHAEEAEAQPAVEAFLQMIETEEDGILPPPTERPKGFYSFNNHVLVVLQAKAMAYALSGNREYGLEALIGIRNYILTMRISWLKADICRHFGYAMYMAACIYDWCYDLMDEDVRAQIICGVAYQLCDGETEGILKAGATQRIDKVKMEMGYPPAKQNAVTGHGCELQLMRDYLSFSIAIYGENPSWWQFVGHRFYTEYPPVRSIYYQAAYYPQGTLYAPFRLQADLWSAWLTQTAIGRIPFDEAGMRQVLPSLLAVETTDGRYLRIGDDHGRNGEPMKHYATCAILHAGLFHDPGMKAWGKWMKTGYSDFDDHDPHFHGTPSTITPAEFLILHSNGILPAEDRHEGMPLVRFNAGYLGQVIARNSFESDAAICLMKGLIRSTANHDHHDAATFQIAYKGLMCGDSGVYETYSSPQHFYYHQATLAHNGMLVFNPAMGDNELIPGPDGLPINRMRYYYSGGQRVVRESSGLENWLTEEYDMASEIGHRFLYDGEKPRALYYAVDATKAYHAETVEHMERHMLTVYTGLAEVPMLLFVYDDVCAKSADFRKAFLLQCPTEPEVEEEGLGLSFEQGQGRLVCHSVLGARERMTFGGPERQFFNPKDDPETHGINIPCIVEGESSDIWGHVEFVTKGESARTEFLHVLYVTDRGQRPAVDVQGLRDPGYVGAEVRVGGRTIAFVKHGGECPNLPEGTECYLVGPDGLTEKR